MVKKINTTGTVGDTATVTTTGTTPEGTELDVVSQTPTSGTTTSEGGITNVAPNEINQPPVYNELTDPALNPPTTSQGLAENIVAGTQEDLKNEDENKTEDLSNAEEQQKANEERIKKQAKETATLIKKQEAEAKLRDEDRKDRIETRGTEQEDALKKKEANLTEIEALEKEKVEASAEAERIKNEQLIVDAKTQTEMLRQQSAWAYQKLGLGFSSGIINQSQQIAQDGINKILNIEATMGLNRQLTNISMRQIGKQIEGIKLEYTDLINKAINKTSDDLDKIDDAAEKRIDKVNGNILLNSQQKENAIAKSLEDYKKEQKQIEKDHMTNMKAIQDRGYKYQKDVEVEIEKERVKGLTNLSNTVLNGTTAGMTQTEINNMEDSLGIPRGTIKQKEDSLIRKGMREIVDNSIGADFIIEDVETIKNEALALMKQGKTLQEATQIATDNYIKGTDEYKRKSALDKAKYNDAMQKATGTGKYAPKPAKAPSKTAYQEMRDAFGSEGTKGTIFQDNSTWATAYNNMIDNGYPKSEIDYLIKNKDYTTLNDMSLRANKNLKGDAIEKGEASVGTLEGTYDWKALSRDINASRDYKNKMGATHLEDGNTEFGQPATDIKGKVVNYVKDKTHVIGNALHTIKDFGDIALHPYASDYFKDDIVTGTKNLIGDMKKDNVPPEKIDNYLTEIIKKEGWNKGNSGVYKGDNGKFYINEFGFDTEIYNPNKK